MLVGADLALEFHFNSAGPKASGACCVCWKYSETGRAFALELAKGMAEVIGIGLTAGGVIVQPSDEERGLMAFKKSKMPFFMLEPCFAGSNETDCQLFTHALLSGGVSKCRGLLTGALRRFTRNKERRMRR